MHPSHTSLSGAAQQQRAVAQRALQTASLHPTASFPTGFCSLRVAACAITIHHASLNKAGSPLQGRRRACLYPQPPARQPRVLQPCHRQPGASPAARSIPGRRRWLRGIKGCVGCVGGAETGEPGWLLSLIRLCSAMDLGPTGQASSLSHGASKAFSNTWVRVLGQCRLIRVLDVSLWE